MSGIVKLDAAKLSRIELAGKIRLYNQDCVDFLKGSGNYDCIFLDPPDNIKLDYDGFNDDRADYHSWLTKLLALAVLRSPVVWLSYNAIHDLEIKSRLAAMLKHGFLTRDVRTIIWRYTFGQYRDTDCGSGYRPILRIARVSWVPKVDEIRVESQRQRIGDVRAAGPKVPDDVWEFPRIVPPNSERRAWHKTQHPEALIKRIFLMSGGIRFLDCFCGSGTSIRVAKRQKSWSLDTCEISESYCERLESEHPGVLC